MMSNEKHHAAIARADRRTAIAVALLVFSVTCLLGAALCSLGDWALLCFIGAVAVYTLTLWGGVFNEGEGATVCEMLLILTLLLLLGLQRVRRIATEATAAADSGPARCASCPAR